jgi:hypothetical protein
VTAKDVEDATSILEQAKFRLRTTQKHRDCVEASIKALDGKLQYTPNIPDSSLGMYHLRTVEGIFIRREEMMTQMKN